MADAALPELDLLVAPIPGPDPAGEDLWSDLEGELNLARKERERVWDDATKQTVDKLKRVDWDAIAKKASGSLTGKTKDMRLAIRLTEAWTRRHGFAGLEHGLTLLRRLFDDAWDRLRPGIEDGDLEARSAPFDWMTDPEKGGLFPGTVRGLTLMRVLARPGAGSLVGDYSWEDFNKPGASAEAAQARQRASEAVAVADPASCRAGAEQVDRCAAALEALGRTLETRLGRSSPSLNGLQDALADCGRLAHELAAKVGPTAAVEATPGPLATGASSLPGPGGAASRADIYRRLAEAAAELRRLEPHSPTPYLIERAVEFGGLTFPQLMAVLIRDSGVLGGMKTELGLKDEAFSKPEDR